MDCGPTMRFPEVRHLGRDDAEKFTHGAPYAVISITDPGTDPVKFMPDTNRVDVLRLACHDIDYLPPELDPVKLQLVLYDEVEAARVAHFVEQHLGFVDLFLVTCEVGLSRSAGVAAAIAMRVLSRTFKPRKGLPNRRFYNQTMRAWE